LTDHLNEDDLRDLVRGDFSVKEIDALIAHLTAECSKCLELLAHVASEWTVSEPAPELSREEEACYDAAIDRAVARVREHALAFSVESAKAPRALASLLALSELGHDDGERVGGWALCIKLMDLSYSFRHKDAAAMLRVALLAYLVATQLEASRYTPALVADFQARCEAELANAYRVSDLLDMADDSMARAIKRSREGTGDPLLQARIMLLTASIRHYQRRYPEALILLAKARVLYRKLGESQLAARTLVMSGIYSMYAGRPEDALPLLEEALGSIDREREPKLFAWALHARASRLVEVGRCEEAARALDEADLQALYAGDSLSLLKARWTEGQALMGLGELDRAEEALASVREGFGRCDQTYNAALVGLDLAVVWLRQGQTGKLLPLVGDVLTTFRVLKISREAVVALVILRQACEQQRVTLDLLHGVARFLRELERDPTMKFEHMPVV